MFSPILVEADGIIKSKNLSLLFFGCILVYSVMNVISAYVQMYENFLQNAPEQARKMDIKMFSASGSAHVRYKRPL